MISKDEVIRQLEELGFDRILEDFGKHGFFYVTNISSITFMRSDQWKFSWFRDRLHYWTIEDGEWNQTDITDVAQLMVLYK